MQMSQEDVTQQHARRTAHGGPQSVALRADVSKTDDVLTPVADLTIHLETGRWYLVKFTFYSGYGGDFGLTGDFGGGSASATAVKGFYTNCNFAGDPVALPVPLDDLTTAIAFAGGDEGMFSGEFVIQVNTGGTVIPRVALAGTTGRADALRKFSTIQAFDVTP